MKVEFDFLDTVKETIAFADPQGGAPVDPTTVAFVFKPPGGAKTTYTFGPDPKLVKDGVGLYRVQIEGNVPGLWTWAWRASGAWPGAVAGHFYVKPDTVP